MKRKHLLCKRYSRHDGDRHLAVVLARTDNQYHPFVTWVYNMNDGGYFWGHYFESLAEAKADYNSRGVNEGSYGAV